ADVPPSDLVTIEAGRLEESRVAALGLRIEAEIESGNAASAIGELLGLTADHPLREELWALLMRALRAAGRQAEALEAYERVRTVIGDELGVDPGPGLRQLYQEILADDARPAPRAVKPAAALVSPEPAPAVHVAHRLRRRFPDGQLYVNLRGASDQPAAPSDVLARFLRELGVDGTQIPESEDERAALYRTRPAGRGGPLRV